MTTHHGHEIDLTKNQSLVFAALNKAEGPLSAYTILDELRDAGFRAPLQVYRALDKLVELGLVHRLESLNAFVACQHPGCEGHESSAFMICNDCGNVIEFSDNSLTQRLAKMAASEMFNLQKTTVELRGSCGKCEAS